jgi:class 3 adenylate cyclase
VILLAQYARALQSDRIIQPLGGWRLAALIAAAALPVLVGGLWRTWGAAWLLAASLAALVYVAYLAGTFVPPVCPLFALVSGATLRSSFEAFRHRRERLAIERQFAGYVSESLLRALLAGEIDPTRPTRYTNLAFLFADLRGFTTMAERLAPEEALARLNRYYAAITPAIHAFDGTIDNFRGDGILVIFGAPRAAADAPRRAGLATIAMFEQLARLNQELVQEGREPLQMGVGLAAGDAVVGNVGTATRHGYSAVGDAVNVAARLQALSKPLGMRVIATAQIAHSCAELGLSPLGQLELAGHAPVEAFGVPVSDSRAPARHSEPLVGTQGAAV